MAMGMACVCTCQQQTRDTGTAASELVLGGAQVCDMHGVCTLSIEESNTT